MPRVVWLTLITIGVIAAAAVVVFAAMYLSSVRRILLRRSRQKPLTEVNDRHVSQRSLNRLTHGFEDDEDVVHWADREHIVVIVPVALALALIAVVLITIAVLLAIHLGEVKYTIRSHGSTPARHIGFSLKYLALLPLALGLVTAATDINLCLRWGALVRSITNKNSRVDIQPWAWAFWLWNDEKHDPQPLDGIERVVDDSPSFMGRVFGYGTIRIVTLLQEDEDKGSHEWRFVRRYEEVAGELRKLSQDAKEKAAQTGSSKEDAQTAKHIPRWTTTLN